MPVRIADSMKQMNDLNSFPVAYGEDIWLDKNKGIGTPNYDSIQNMYNNSELSSGGSSIQVDTMPIASEYPNKTVQYVGESGTYQNGFFYQSTSDEQDPPTYSWVQKNVQPSNATATDVSYDNTTSELVATNVQDAIDEIKGGLGTASGKNFTDLVRPNSHELVESGSVYSAINNALSSIYTPRGELTCAELTSSLLIEDNVGNIYTMSDSGTTSALFINGAGQTINVGDNVGIIKAGADTYLFNLMGDAFDLHDYQKKELSTTIASATTVEGALSALNNGKVTKYNYTMIGTASLEDDIKTFVTALIALGANTYVGFFNRSGSLGTAGNYSITVYAEEGTSTFASGYIVLGAGALGKTQYIVSYYKPAGSSEEWTIKKLATGFATQSSTDMFADLNLEAGQTYHLYDIWSKIYAKYGECNFVGSVKWVGANSFSITDGTNTIQVTNGTFILNCPTFTQFWISMNGSFTLGTKTALKSYSIVCTKDTSSFQEEINQLVTTDSINQLKEINSIDTTANPSILNLLPIGNYVFTWGAMKQCTDTPTLGDEEWQVSCYSMTPTISVIGDEIIRWQVAYQRSPTPLMYYRQYSYISRAGEPYSYKWSDWQKLVTESDLTSSVTSGSTAPITSGGVYDYLASSPLIGQVTTTLGRLGFGALVDNFLKIQVCPSAEIINNPFGTSGNCLYIEMGIVEFVVGALSADASQWTPNTGVAYRVRHGSVWQSWHILTQN